MEYCIMLFLMLGGILAFHEISNVKKELKHQEDRLNQLARLTGNSSLSSDWVSDEVKELAIHLKQTGNEVKAVKLIREHTKMSLLNAKQYIDQLH